MNLAEHLRRIACPSCAWQRVFGPEEMMQWLRAQGKLRRERKPDGPLVQSLFLHLLPTAPCPECGHAGLRETVLDDSPDGWGDARSCEVCRGVIPSERLEIFPQATRCARCQDAPTRSTQPDDYCPRCGGLIQLRAQRAGVVRYVAHCSSCGYRG